MPDFRSHNADRLRRADSWLAHSRKVTSADEKFIFLWIAFNAAYGSWVHEEDAGSVERDRNFKNS